MNYEYETVNQPIFENKKYNEETEEEEVEESTYKLCYKSLYFITHIIISFFAIYLSWKCNGGEFNLPSFMLALICPHFYVIYALAINGGCGLFANELPYNKPIIFKFPFN